MKLVWIALAVAAVSVSAAHADVPKKCLAPLVFVPGEGCVKPPPPKATAADPYYKGLEVLDTDPKKAFALFEESCKKKHGPACTQVGVFYAFGRSRVVTRDQAKANTHWERACELGDGAGCQRRGNYATNQSNYTEAKKFFERGCERRDGTACAQLAYFTEHGLFGKADPAAAKTLYAKAHKILAQTCTPRNGFACMVRGYLFEKGYGVAANPVEAVKNYEAACTANNADACWALVSHYEKAKQPEAKIIAVQEKACVYDRADACSAVARRMTIADPKSTRAVELAQRGCDLDTKECNILAELYRLGRGTKEDQTKATTLFESICKTGDHSICVTYATRLRQGVGVKADPLKANTILDESCKANEADACKQLALYLSNDKTDDVRAYKTALKGCDLKAGFSCYLAGWMILHTRRGDPSQSPEDAGKEALPHLEKGCELGSPEACDSAGDLHRNGTGTAKDPQKALERYTKGCDAEYPSGNACGSLAVIAYNGEGIAKDRKKAARAASRGCVHDQEYACKWLPQFASEPELVTLVSTELAPACQRGKHEVCVWQARVLMFRGDRTAKQQGFAIAANTCKQKHESSCTLHGTAVYYGYGGDNEDKAQGESLLKRYCEDGYGSACSQLSTWYSSDKKDHPAALRYADMGCNLKNAESCSQAGYQHYTAQPGVEWLIDRAASYYQKSCELGSPGGCANHAELLRFGIMAKVDHANAYKLYQKACDGESAYGCTGAAWYVARGEGGAKKDVPLATQMYKKGCDDENPEACAELALLQEQSKGATPSEIERLRIRAMAMAMKYQADNPMYRYWVGTYHQAGIGVPKDPAKATEWFVKACEGFDPLGCIAAGRALAQSPTASDREKARAYFGRACAAGIDDGCTGKASVAEVPQGSAAPAKPEGPPPVAKGKGCACGGQIAPSADGALLLLALASLVRRRRRR